MILCENCAQRGDCRALCAEAEAYVGQDYVKLKELPTASLDYTPFELEEGIVELDENDWIYLVRIVKMTKKQKKYTYLHYWKGCSFAEIARRYGTCRQNIYKIIKKVGGRLRWKVKN